MMPLLQDPGSWLRLPSWPPGWDGLHPWMVHCPMALLLTVPVFVFLAMILFKWGRWMSLTALVLWGLALVGASLSVSTGLAARDYLSQSSVKLSPEALQVLEKHQQLASTILPLYGGLFVIYLVLFLLSIAVRPFDNPVWLFFMNLIFLILLLLAGLVLVNTGELGGRLVHEFGVRGRIGPARPEAEKPPLPEHKPKPPEEKVVPKEKPKPPEEKPAPSEKPPAAKEKPPALEEKPKPSEEKLTPKEEPGAEEKPKPPEEKVAPQKESGAKEKREMPEEKRKEKAAPETPSEEKPSEKASEKQLPEKPASPPPPTKEQPEQEKEPSAKQSGGPSEKPSAKEPASGDQKPSEKTPPGQSEPGQQPFSSPQNNSAKPDSRSPGGQQKTPAPAEDRIA